MALLEKSVTVSLAGLVLLVIGIKSAYWWASTAPNRPPGVPSAAVFLWAPAVGLPSPRRGNWLHCWEDASGHDQCRLTAQNGAVLYQGEFIPYRQTAKVPLSHLEIDSVRSQEHRVWVGGELVPLVYLANGQILLPAAKYNEGSALLDRSK